MDTICRAMQPVPVNLWAIKVPSNDVHAAKLIISLNTINHIRKIFHTLWAIAWWSIYNEESYISRTLEIHLVDERFILKIHPIILTLLTFRLYQRDHQKLVLVLPVPDKNRKN